MDSHISLGLVVLLCAGCGAPPPSDEGEALSVRHDPIVGGEACDPSEFPAVGFLRAREDSTQPWVQFCSATLVGRRTVLTAGHCLKNTAKVTDGIKNGNLEFALGAAENSVTASVAIVGMRGPTDVSDDPDIAVAFLATPIGVEPMALRTQPVSGLNWLGQTVRLIGYGASSNLNNYEGRGVRRSVEVEVVDPAALSPPVDLPNDIPYLVFHADPSNPKGACNGDSGGPAIHKNPDTQAYDVVAVSSGANSKDCIHSTADEKIGATYWYQRTDVQHELLVCDPALCSYHGLCFKPDRCDCDKGYQGNDCSQPAPEGCADSPCFPGVTCTDATPPATGYTCGDCPPGHVGDGKTCVVADAGTDTGAASPEASSPAPEGGSVPKDAGSTLQDGGSCLYGSLPEGGCAPKPAAKFADSGETGGCQTRPLAGLRGVSWIAIGVLGWLVSRRKKTRSNPRVAAHK